jgi:hypothetical protein
VRDLRDLIEAVLGDVDFPGPTVAYCAAVYAELKSRRPGVVADVCIRPGEIRVTADLEDARASRYVQL